MKYSYKRSEKVASLIQREINILLHRELYEFSSFLVTITGVEVADDLKQAKIYYSVLGGDDLKARAEDVFTKKLGRIRFELGKKMKVRSVPNIKFCYDTTVHSATRIETILGEISKKKTHD